MEKITIAHMGFTTEGVFRSRELVDTPVSQILREDVLLVSYLSIS